MAETNNREQQHPNSCVDLCEASTANPVVSNLLSICSVHNRLYMLPLSVFYQPGTLNTMSNNASCHFDLSANPFLELFSYKYSSQSPGSWTMFHLPTEVLSSMISALRKYTCVAATSSTARPSPYTSSGPPSAPTCRSATFLKTQTSHL